VYAGDAPGFELWALLRACLKSAAVSSAQRSWRYGLGGSV